MNKLARLVISLTLLFSLVLLTSPSKLYAASYKPGDIFITKSTSSKGVTGHIGIAIDSKTILHTSGWKTEPYPLPISIANWNKRYPQTKVIRPKSASLGKNAAKQAINNFKGKKIPYRVTPNPKNIKETYCSELVWYAYYKAGKQYKVFEPGSQITTWKVPSIIKPYDYTSSRQVSYNGFTFVDNKW